MDISDTFREKLKHIRMEKGLDAANLSLAAGLNRRAVTDIETGASKSPTLRTASRLADALGVSLLELTSGESRSDITCEWRNFLSRYDEEDQRKLLAALQSLRGPPFCS